MARYIDKDKVIDEIARLANRSIVGEMDEPYLDWKTVVSVIFDAQAADVQEVRHGRWISNELGGYKWAYYCSGCGWVDGYPFNDRHKYCPNCGTIMCKDVK